MGFSVIITTLQRTLSPLFLGSFTLLINDPLNKKNSSNPLTEGLIEDLARNTTDNDIPTLIELLKSPYLLTRATIGKMKQKQWGRIINISSEVYQLSVSPFSAYVSAKGGQIGWTRSMSKELAPFGITVNTVNPGWIPTERHNDDPQEDKDAYLEQIPAGRWGVPEDVGEAVAYFASEEASFITGQTICVNGGNSPW